MKKKLQIEILLYLSKKIIIILLVVDSPSFNEKREEKRKLSASSAWISMCIGAKMLMVIVKIIEI